jgi:hypothetical protein
MLGTLAGLKSKESWVEERAQATMAEMHPSVLEQREKMRALVADGLAGYTEARLLADMAALRRKDPTIGHAPAEVIKRAAALIVEKTRLDRLTPGVALQQQRAAATKAQKHFAKGEWAKAALANRQALLNAALHRELLQARDERGKLEGFAQSLSKTAARERLGKADAYFREAHDGQQGSYLSAVDFLLESLGFRKAEHAQDLDVGVLQRAAAQMAESGALVDASPIWLASLSGALSRGVSDYSKLDVATARDLTDALKSLTTAARNANEVLDGEHRVEKDMAVAQLVQEFAENKDQAPDINASGVVA